MEPQKQQVIQTVEEESLPSNRGVIVIIVFTVIIVIGVVAFIAYYNSRRTIPDDVDIFSPGNNCCNESDYGQCTTDPEWIDGFYACNDQRCAKCQTGTTVAPNQCNNNRQCEQGEHGGNCPSDCDDGGFDESPAGTACNPTNGDNGRDDCDGDANAVCTRCPATSTRSTQSFCAPRTMTPATMTTTYCGGPRATATPTVTPSISQSTTPTPTFATATPTPTLLPDTALERDNIAKITIGILLVIFGVVLNRERRRFMEKV